MPHDFFEIQHAKRIKLSCFPTKPKPNRLSEEKYQKKLKENHSRIEELQTRLYADRSRAVLIVFQGMDTSGKDGAIKHVMSGVNPQGCSVVSFKTPTVTDLEHDFLWRVNRALPARGQIGIFNRSYYEETLITRVHPEMLLDERLPGDIKFDKSFWKFRYDDVVNYEKYLHRQGYEIIKIFLHISKGEQKHRLLERFKEPNKHWKISEGDIRERAFWDEYQAAYEECLGRTSSKSCPWYIVPGDNKEVARLSIAKILVSRLVKLNLHYPKLSLQQMKDLKSLQARLIEN